MTLSVVEDSTDSLAVAYVLIMSNTIYKISNTTNHTAKSDEHHISFTFHLSGSLHIYNKQKINYRDLT